MNGNTRRGMMLVATVAIILIAAKPEAPKPDMPVGPYLQQISVNIKASSGSRGAQGSGTIILVPREGPDRSAWVITAHHVVEDLREVSSVIDDDGSEKKAVRYKDAQVVQEKHTPDGSRGVGETRLDAKIVNIDKARDIALLRVRAVDEFKHSARFYLDGDLPAVGTPVLHCGAPGGMEIGGTATLTSGIVSRTGVRIPEFGGSEDGIYDQTDVAALGGSSGGLLALAGDGRWVGMITLGLSGDSFHWFVPVRNVREWAAEIGVEWLLDEEGRLPSEDEIRKIPLENSKPGFAAAKKRDEPTPARMHLLWRGE